MAALSFLWQYWQWIVIGALAVVVLGYVAFILRNWKIAAAVIAIVCAFLGAQALYNAGYNARVAVEVADRTKLIQARLDTLEFIAAGDKVRADADAETIRILTEQASATPANSTAALPADVVKRIGAIK